MKKTISIIYRLAFLIFGIWAILENVSYNLLKFLPSLQNFTVFSNFLFIICMLTAFYLSLKKKTYSWLIHLKGICAFLSLFILTLNFNLIFQNISTQWALKILLPFMMILDWFLFNQKEKIKIQDLLLWLAGLAALIFGFAYLLNKVFGIKDFLASIGLDNFSDILKHLLPLLLFGFVIYLLDNLFTSKGRRNFTDIFKLLFRLLFIILETFAFYKLSDMKIAALLHSLSNYIPLVNFLNLLCIIVLVLCWLFGSDKKNDSLFPRLKAFFTIALSAVLLIQIFIIKDYKNLTTINTIHNLIAPSMMIIDLILFDNKSTYKTYDPIIWISLPVLYSILNTTMKFSDYSYYSVTTLGSGFLILLVLGYLFYLIGKIKRP